MSEPENFLARWSRRKHVAGEEPDQPAPDLPAQLSEAAPETPAQDGEPASKPAVGAAEPPAPVFDPASLPSLDSIGAQTDIRAFLQAGVPGELRLAALRRAWSADPAIRDFKGLAENDWDFTAPNSMLGFGEIGPGVDVKKMLAQMFGETPHADEPPTEIPAPAEQSAPPTHDSSSPTERAAIDSIGESARDSEIFHSTRIEAIAGNDLVQREENIATQDDNAELGNAQIKRRRSQGSALPE
jgi:hypothetical protein